jgi:hypothetical protein
MFSINPESCKNVFPATNIGSPPPLLTKKQKQTGRSSWQSEFLHIHATIQFYHKKPSCFFRLFATKREGICIAVCSNLTQEHHDHAICVCDKCYACVTHAHTCATHQMGLCTLFLSLLSPRKRNSKGKNQNAHSILYRTCCMCVLVHHAMHNTHHTHTRKIMWPYFINLAKWLPG